jgi:hypothetical protein
VRLQLRQGPLSFELDPAQLLGLSAFGSLIAAMEGGPIGSREHDFLIPEIEVKAPVAWRAHLNSHLISSAKRGRSHSSRRVASRLSFFELGDLRDAVNYENVGVYVGLIFAWGKRTATCIVKR